MIANQQDPGRLLTSPWMRIPTIQTIAPIQKPAASSPHELLAADQAKITDDGFAAQRPALIVASMDIRGGGVGLPTLSIRVLYGGRWIISGGGSNDLKNWFSHVNKLALLRFAHPGPLAAACPTCSSTHARSRPCLVPGMAIGPST